ncbi:heparan-alpha-glucosaminide N-acetyltransferase domain-containing protein, partial [Nesterenkonia aurantiaca]|uniref:heparan-alpha-glucosaminide N-acetyltransferase domain-containing protein n=1 Tax=Nesterenkonia aurantiaca TaxID=1436010 RepID=UPI003EE62E41
MSETSTTGAPGVKETSVRSRGRLVGIDAARGLALLGLMAIHLLPAWNEETGGVSWSWRLFSGDSAALFALLAGVGLALTSGGRNQHQGRTMTADRVGLLVRALLIAVVGLWIGTVMPQDPPAYGILLYYGVFFLLAIP